MSKVPAVSKAEAAGALETARKHEHLGQMASSAKFCADDAEHLLARGDYNYAMKRAATSLGYSVGIAHPDYIAIRTRQGANQ